MSKLANHNAAKASWDGGVQGVGWGVVKENNWTNSPDQRLTKEWKVKRWAKTLQCKALSRANKRWEIEANTTSKTVGGINSGSSCWLKISISSASHFTLFGFSALIASRQNDNNHHALAHALNKTCSGFHRCLLCLSSSFNVHQGTASSLIEQQQALSSGLSSNRQYWRALGQLGKRCQHLTLNECITVLQLQQGVGDSKWLRLSKSKVQKNNAHDKECNALRKNFDLGMWKWLREISSWSFSWTNHFCS